MTVKECKSTRVDFEDVEVCEECGMKLFESDAGAMVCRACGLVHHATFTQGLYVDGGAEMIGDRSTKTWQFTAVFKPQNLLFLRPIIAPKRYMIRDCKYRILGPRVQYVMFRANKIQKRASPYYERRLYYANEMLDTVTRVLRIPDQTRVKAVYLFWKLQRAIAQSRFPFTTLIMCALYIATKTERMHVSIDDLVSIAYDAGYEINRRVVMAGLKRCSAVMKIPVTIDRGYDQFIARVEETTGKTLNEAINMLDGKVKRTHVQSPKVGARAGALIYAAGVLAGNSRVTEACVAHACQTSEVTIRKLYYRYYKSVVDLFSSKRRGGVHQNESK